MRIFAINTCRMKKIFTLVLLAFSLNLLGQEVTSSNVWMKLAWKTELSKKWDLTLDGQYRSAMGYDNNEWISEVELERRLTKRWDIGTEFRHYLIFDTRGGNQGTFQRVRGQVNLKQEIPLPVGDLNLRYAVQQRVVLTGGGANKLTYRVRAGYDLPIKNWGWDPTFQVEWLESPGVERDRAVRYGLETSDKLGGIRLSFGYFYERDYTVLGANAHVFQTGIRF